MLIQTQIRQLFAFFGNNKPSVHPRILFIERTTEEPQIVTDLKNVFYIHITTGNGEILLHFEFTSDPIQKNSPFSSS